MAYEFPGIVAKDKDAVMHITLIMIYETPQKK